MKVYGWRRTAPLLLHLGASLTWVVSITPRPLYFREYILVPTAGKDRFVEEKNLVTNGIRTRDSPARSLVTILTELYTRQRH